MDKAFWHQKWEKKEIGFNQSQPNKLMQHYFSSLELKPRSRVFVPLCGQSIDMLWLVNQGYKVVGIELSQIACTAFFKEFNIPVKITDLNDFIVYSSDEITIFSGDFFKLSTSVLGKIDAVYDRAALIALPEDIRKSYSEHLIKLMTPTTSMFLITTKYNQNEMQGPPFSLDKAEVTALYGANFDINQLYSNKLPEVPPHLQAKGLVQAKEQVYTLTRKNTQ